MLSTKDNSNTLYNYLLDTFAEPIRLDKLMHMALYNKEYGYYSRYNPFSNGGDFITAPKISQMFGEIIAAFGIHKLTSNNIHKFTIIEIGPGDGTLMSDILRVIPQEHIAKVYLVENSDFLRSIQQTNLANYDIEHISHINEAHTDYPCFIVANELFDAMPIRQFQKINNEFHEAFVGAKDGVLQVFYLPTNENFLNYYQNIPNYGIVEYPEFALHYLNNITKFLGKHTGVFITFDYGYTKNEKFVSSIQAVKSHQYVPWLENIGEADITSHIDFTLLQSSIPKDFTSTITTQAGFLLSNGIAVRARTLLARHPDKYDIINSALSRLTHPKLMGELFKCLIVHNLK